jgi:hypothetical protein
MGNYVCCKDDNINRPAKSDKKEPIRQIRHTTNETK